MRTLSLQIVLLILPMVVRAAAGGDDPAARESFAAAQWKNKLGLSGDQSRKFLAAEKTREADVRALRDQINGALFRIREQLAGGAAEIDVQETLLRVARLRRSLHGRNDRFDEEISSFLTPFQRAKLLVWRSLIASRADTSVGVEPGDPRESVPVGEEELE